MGHVIEVEDRNVYQRIENGGVGISNGGKPWLRSVAESIACQKDCAKNKCASDSWGDGSCFMRLEGS